MNYKAVRGMKDILPEDIETWRHLEDIARCQLEVFGYEEIRTPLLEDTSIFSRSIGETTDIVTKEMYTFEDRKGRSLTLRPEGTAPIVRAYVEHAMYKTSPVSRLYYIGPMFRSERPQKGRSRQFHQIGAEIFGSGSHNEAMVIMQLSGMLKSFKLDNFTIKLNSLGCKMDKDKFTDEMKKYLEDKKQRLCQDCKKRMKKNVLRVLDCKNESCIQVVRQAPNVMDSLCAGCQTRFDGLKNTLRNLEIAFVETKNLVRGLDYYTGTVFEITHPALGAQDAIGAGGRYDNLVKDLGGPSIPAFGYALGIDRIITVLKETKNIPKPEALYVIPLGVEAKKSAMNIVSRITIAANLIEEERREKHKRIKVILGNDKTSLKSQIKNADKNSAKFIIILGENELKKEIPVAVLRNMDTKQQTEVPLKDIAVEVMKRIGTQC